MRLPLQPRSRPTNKNPAKSAIDAQGTVGHTSYKSGLLVGLIVLITLMAYIPALQGGFIWDDDAYVTENPTLRSVQGLARIWLEPRSTPQYYPLVFSSFWVEYHLWKLHPLGFHLVNVLLHAGSAILLPTSPHPTINMGRPRFFSPFESTTIASVPVIWT